MAESLWARLQRVLESAAPAVPRGGLNPPATVSQVATAVVLRWSRHWSRHRMLIQPAGQLWRQLGHAAPCGAVTRLLQRRHGPRVTACFQALAEGLADCLITMKRRGHASSRLAGLLRPRACAGPGAAISRR